MSQGIMPQEDRLIVGGKLSLNHFKDGIELSPTNKYILTTLQAKLKATYIKYLYIFNRNYEIPRLTHYEKCSKQQKYVK